MWSERDIGCAVFTILALVIVAAVKLDDFLCGVAVVEEAVAR